MRLIVVVSVVSPQPRIAAQYMIPDSVQEGAKTVYAQVAELGGYRSSYDVPTF